MGAEGKQSRTRPVHIVYFGAMKKSILYFLILLASASNLNAQESDSKTSDIKSLRRDVSYLADDKLEGRETGTKGERMAAKFIRKRYAKIGVKPYAQKFSKKIRPADIDPHKDIDLDTVKATVVKGLNVTGIIDNGAPTSIVIGAHYDHLGWGGAGSLAPGIRAIHNGADDNASGVATMLLLADWLKDTLKKHNYIFIAFSGEEKGLWGSNFFVKNTDYPIEKFDYMINMDMVGRLNDERKLAVNGSGTSPSWKPALEKANTSALKVVQKESGIGPSDHTSFYLADIPVLHFFTGQHSDYHKPSDDVEKVNFEGMYDVASYIFNVIVALEETEKLAFTKTKDESSETPRFKVTLGVVPDYLFDGTGMRLDGVREGKPAKNAGMQKGDIVLQMGDVEVKNMMSYMKALGQFEKGQSTTVRFKRGEDEQEVQVTF